MHLRDQLNALRERTTAMTRRRDWLLLGLALVATAALGWASVLAAAGGPDKSKFVNLVAGWSDEEKQALVDETHRAERDFVVEFTNSGRDPRSLSRAPIESAYIAGQKNISEAVAVAARVVHGMVTRVSYAGFDDGRPPRSTATVQIIATLKGDDVSSINVSQTGGPLPGGQGDNGTLVYLDADELLLPGDEVVLILSEAGDGTSQPLAATGIYFVRGGLIEVEALNPFGSEVAGSSRASFGQLLRKAVSSGPAAP